MAYGNSGWGGNKPIAPITSYFGQKLSPEVQRMLGYDNPGVPPPTWSTPQPVAQTPAGKTPAQLAAHMAQRNNITNAYVDPGQAPKPQQLAAHMAANAAYTTGYGSNSPVPIPPWLQSYLASTASKF